MKQTRQFNGELGHQNERLASHGQASDPQTALALKTSEERVSIPYLRLMWMWALSRSYTTQRQKSPVKHPNHSINCIRLGRPTQKWRSGMNCQLVLLACKEVAVLQIKIPICADQWEAKDSTCTILKTPICSTVTVSMASTWEGSMMSRVLPHELPLSKWKKQI